MTLDLFAKVSARTAPAITPSSAGKHGAPAADEKAGNLKSHDCARCGLLMVLVLGKELPTLCFDCSPMVAP